MSGPRNFTMRVDLTPLVVVTVHDDLSIEDMDAMFDAFRGILAKKARFVSLADVRGAKRMPSAKERARVAENMRNIEDLSVQFSLGTAMVVSSPLVRGAMTAINWIHKPKVPQAYFDSLIEGCEWCVDRLRGAGLAVTPAIAAYQAGLAEKKATRTGAA
jgi:hypothetical protein